eukprot:scaffold1610_cov39-Cyclotella_meneghiniana.AAC.3
MELCIHCSPLRNTDRKGRCHGRKRGMANHKLVKIAQCSSRQQRKQSLLQRPTIIVIIDGKFVNREVAAGIILP